MDNKIPIRICKSCGVELAEDMPQCPLCDEGTLNEDFSNNSSKKPIYVRQKFNRNQKKLLWEILSISLVSGSIATFAIDVIINSRISWSEYPAAISLSIFAYISLFAFWDQRIIIQLAGGFVLSSLFIVIVDVLSSTLNWSLALGIPILFSANMIIIAEILLFRITKYKGVSLIAYMFLGAAFLCIFIDGILSYYLLNEIQLTWSVIVSGSILPVALVLFFMHFRLKKGRDLRKTFHL